MMRVTVLGGNGFIGTHVVDAMIAAGHGVRVFGRRAETLRKPLPQVDYRIADMSDSVALGRALKGSDAVVHLISTTHPASAEQDPIADVNGNLIGTMRLLQLMRAAGVQRLLYMSSGGAVYGIPQVLPTPETHRQLPIGSYGIVKSAVERYVAAAAGKGLTATVIRPANAYGPRQTGTAGAGFISTALRQLARGEQIRIYGDGAVVRDYLHARDLASLCVMALGSAEGMTLNAGSGRGRSLLEVVAAMEQVTGRTARLDFGLSRPVDVPVSILDCTLAKRRLGWTPGVTFEDGLAETWAWVLAQQ